MAQPALKPLWRWYLDTSDSKAGGQWKCRPESDYEDILQEAYHVNVLAVDVADTPGTSTADYSEAKYRGDYVIDIDRKNPDKTGNIAGSILDAHAVASWLSKFVNLEWVQIYASGGKGFHLVVPWALAWGSLKTKANLRAIYKALTERVCEETGAQGIDTGLWAEKKGHLIRVPNKLRPDGKYKVPLTREEFWSITPELYAEYVKAPRRVDVPEGSQSVGLKALMDQAEREAGRPKKVVESLERPAVLDALPAGTLPPCMEHAIADERPEGVSFNSLAVQVAVFANARPEVADNLIARFAEAQESSSLGQPEGRRENVTQLRASVKGYRFSCAATLKALENKSVCADCPVHKAAQEKPKTGQVVEKDGMYYRVDGKGEALPFPLTDFTIEISSVLSDDTYKGESHHDFTGLMANLMKAGETVYRNMVLSPESFLNIHQFRATLARARAANIFAGEADLPHLRAFLMSKLGVVEAVNLSETIGIKNLEQISPATGEPIKTMTWVEPGWSVNKFGLTGQATYAGQEVEHVAKMENRRPAAAEDKDIEEVLLDLLGMNVPHIMGRAIGWTASCNIREHRIDGDRDYPFLCLFGPAGVGKNKTAQIVSALAGADYFSKDPFDVANNTPWPRLHSCIQSTTVPRIWDECAPSKMPQKTWMEVRGLLRNLYQHTSVSKGGIGDKGKIRSKHGLKTTSYDLTSPVIALSTIPLTNDPELESRVVLVDMTARKLSSDAEMDRYGQAFERIWTHQKRSKEALFSFSYAMILKSMRMREDTLWARLSAAHKELPRQFKDRTMTNYGWTLAGLDFFIETLRDLGYDKALAKATEVRQETLRFLHGTAATIALEKARTEVDMMLDYMGTLVRLRGDENRGPALKKDVHFYVYGDKLYLDFVAAFGVWAMSKILRQEYKEYQNVKQAEDAIRQSHFFIGEEALPESDNDDKYMVLDIPALVARGNASVNRFRR